MKEYKILSVKSYRSMERVRTKLENLINEVVIEGWEVNSTSFTYNMWGYNQGFVTLERPRGADNYV
ncbi:MAG: hypothetical protein AB8G22_28360 [Saprospiraceae bacterium]